LIYRRGSVLPTAAQVLVRQIKLRAEQRAKIKPQVD